MTAAITFERFTPKLPLETPADRTKANDAIFSKAMPFDKHERPVLRALTKDCNWRTSQTWKRPQTMAEETGLGESTVRKTLTKLRRRGVVSWITRPTKTGRENLYTVHDFSHLAGQEACAPIPQFFAPARLSKCQESALPECTFSGLYPAQVRGEGQELCTMHLMRNWDALCPQLQGVFSPHAALPEQMGPACQSRPQALAPYCDPSHQIGTPSIPLPAQGEENSNSDPVEEACRRVLERRRDVLEPKSPLAVSEKGIRVLRKRFRELLAAGHTLKAAETILHDVIDGARTHSDYAFSYMRRVHVLFGSERIGELCEFARSRRRSRELRDRALEERRLLRSGPTPRVESSVLEQAQINVVGALEALAALNRAADDVDAAEVAANAGCAA